jgi:hypothetical protein
MQVTTDQLLLCAYKLIETFAPPVRGDPFERYWALVGALEAFSESATSPYEQAVAKTLRSALEGRLREWAPGSLSLHAESVALHLGVERRRFFAPRHPKYKRRPVRNRRR